LARQRHRQGRRAPWWPSNCSQPHSSCTQRWCGSCSIVDSSLRRVQCPREIGSSTRDVIAITKFCRHSRTTASRAERHSRFSNSLCSGPSAGPVQKGCIGHDMIGERRKARRCCETAWRLSSPWLDRREQGHVAWQSQLRSMSPATCRRLAHSVLHLGDYASYAMHCPELY
jgi:hypothetical protein